MSDYADIINSLMNLKHSDRDVDEKIAQLVGWTQRTFNVLNINGVTEHGDIWVWNGCTEDEIEDMITEYRHQVVYGFYPPDNTIPHYTGSIDAALGLLRQMLPEWRVENLCEWEASVLRDRGEWTCDLVRNHSTTDFSDQSSHSKCQHAFTPALAMLMALFKALDNLNYKDKI